MLVVVWCLCCVKFMFYGLERKEKVKFAWNFKLFYLCGKL